MSKYNVDEETLRKLHSEGLGNREIGRRLEVPHWKIGRELKRLGLTTNVLRGAPPEPVDELHSRCSKCQNVVLNTDFPYVQGRADGRRLSYCKKCRYRQYRQNTLSSPERYWRERTNQIRRRSAEKGTPFNLPEDYLYSLWVQQDGKCFYTDVVMDAVFDRGLRSTSASVDKVEIPKGYIIGNIVLCTSRANSIKYDQTLEELRLWMPTWYERLESRL